MSKLQNWATRKYIEVRHGGEEGQGLAEYGLILALIAVVCATALVTLQGGISTTLGNVSAKL